jgi:hypothetical protein
MDADELDMPADMDDALDEREDELQEEKLSLLACVLASRCRPWLTLFRNGMVDFIELILSGHDTDLSRFGEGESNRRSGHLITPCHSLLVTTTVS